MIDLLGGDDDVKLKPPSVSSLAPVQLPIKSQRAKSIPVNADVIDLLGGDDDVKLKDDDTKFAKRQKVNVKSEHTNTPTVSVESDDDVPVVVTTKRINERKYMGGSVITKLTVGGVFRKRKPNSKSSNLNEFISDEGKHFLMNIGSEKDKVSITGEGDGCPPCFKKYLPEMTAYAQSKDTTRPQNGGDTTKNMLNLWSMVKGRFTLPPTSTGKKPELVIIGDIKNGQKINYNLKQVLGGKIPEEVKDEIMRLHHSDNDFLIVTLPTCATDHTATVWKVYDFDGCARQKGEHANSIKRLNNACARNN